MGSLPKMKLLMTLLLAAFLALFGQTKGLPNTNVTTLLCNGRVYAENDPFAISLAYVLAELQVVTPTRKGYDYYNISPYPNAFAYGHALCKQTLSSKDCGTCVEAAKTAMLGGCESRIGARTVLVDCAIRYEQYPFAE